MRGSVLSLYLFQPLLGEAVGGPFIQGDGTHGAVEVYAGLVPIEAHPFHSATLALTGYAGELEKERFAITLATVLGLDIEVFQIEAASAQKGGEVVKEQGKAYFTTILYGKENLGTVQVEELLLEGVDIGDYLVLHLLVSGYATDEVEDEVGVLALGLADVEFIVVHEAW